MSPSELARVLRAAAAECDAIESERRAEIRAWVAQAKSDLGPRRHCAAVRRRVAAGLDGASIVGRKFLLSPAALEEELARRSRGERNVEPTSGPDALRRKLGLVGGTRGG
jgi:hypothetical protein